MAQPGELELIAELERVYPLVKADEGQLLYAKRRIREMASAWQLSGDDINLIIRSWLRSRLSLADQVRLWSLCKER
jgi:hypothetical protein